MTFNVITHAGRFVLSLFQGWTGRKFQKPRVLKLIAIVLAISIFNLTIGCRSYFKVTSSPVVSSESVGGLKDAGKTFIIFSVVVFSILISGFSKSIN